MRRLLLAALPLLAPVAALAVANGFSPDDQNWLAGEWATKCGEHADGSELYMYIEFAATGGQVAFDDGTEGGGTFAIKNGTVNANRVSLNLAEAGDYEFIRNGMALKGTAGDMAAGKVFIRCAPPADRSAIHLDSKALRYLSSAMPPDHATFIDTRAKGGCGATDYMYLTIDLVGPLGYTIGRWNSSSLAEKVAQGKSSSFDEVTNFTIDKAESMGGNYRFTITEKIPPNGSRGDTTTITLLPSPTGVVTIPEWKRSYRRCFAHEE